VDRGGRAGAGGRPLAGVPVRYDLVVIGGGPAGEKGAAQAAYFGKRVAIVEAQPALGGAAANTGTLPSKTLRETSLFLSGLRARGLYGVDLSIRREATVSDLLYRERQVVEVEQRRAEENVRRHGIDLLRGRARLTGPHAIAVTSAGGEVREVEAEVILITTGSSPRRPPLFPFDHPCIYDSDSILSLRAVPERLVVVGGGVIGTEYACTFAALDREVSLIDSGPRLLPFLDAELSTALRAGMERLGIRIVAPERVKSCAAGDGSVTLTLGSGEEIEGDAVLVAAGRISNTATLGLESAGISMDETGKIPVDAHYRTVAPHIYAAGDVIGFPALASTSMEQARIAMVHAFDLKYKTEFAPILPYGIYTIPELSMAGETEESLQKSGTPYVVGRADYGRNARGIIIGDDAGFLKLLFHRDDMRLLGVHIIGEQATEILHIGLTAMMCGATSELFIRTCYNYPTLGELYKYATYDAMGRRQRMSGNT
jgi:NAD(P) transhydrogenase